MSRMRNFLDVRTLSTLTNTPVNTENNRSRFSKRRTCTTDTFRVVCTLLHVNSQCNELELIHATEQTFDRYLFMGEGCRTNKYNEGHLAVCANAFQLPFTKNHGKQLCMGTLLGEKPFSL